MKLSNSRTVTGQLGTERTAMSIAVNGKAFATLVKGIYSNPIRAFVREVSTNALDGHIAAGIADQPFHVSMPDMLDPYFRVRDYGVSMDHDTVINVFGTIFESTKDHSNDMVGAFGLGSKSPLSYADTFTVTAWLDGEKRVYIVSIDADGTPVIDSLAPAESDQPNGIEVAIPIRDTDYTRVADEARDVLAWFDVLPTVVGLPDLAPMERLYSTSNGEAFVVKRNGPQVIVRQGCVAYGVDEWEITGEARRNLTHGYALVLDVPMGTVQPIRSREGLELDETSRADLTRRVEEAVADIAEMVDTQFAACANRLEAKRLYHEVGVAEFWQGQVGFRGFALHNNWLPLTPNKGETSKARRPHTIPVVRQGTSRGLNGLTNFHYHNLSNLVFVIDRPEVVKAQGLKRTMMRYKEAVNNGIDGRHDVYLLTDPSPRLIARLMRVWGLGRDQFVWIGDLPDPGPAPKRAKGEPNENGITGVTQNHGSYGLAVHEFPDEYYWVNLHRPSKYERIELDRRYNAMIRLGAEELPLLVFSNKATERFTPPAEQEFKAVEKATLDAQRDVVIRQFAYAQFLPTWGGRTVAMRAAGVEFDSTLMENTRRSLTTDDWAEIERLSEELHSDLKERYPLIFDASDAEWDAYIAARDAELDS